MPEQQKIQPAAVRTVLSPQRTKGAPVLTKQGDKIRQREIPPTSSALAEEHNETELASDWTAIGLQKTVCQLGFIYITLHSFIDQLLSSVVVYRISGTKMWEANGGSE